jgi:hypothetical protein
LEFGFVFFLLLLLLLFLVLFVLFPYIISSQMASILIQLDWFAKKNRILERSKILISCARLSNCKIYLRNWRTLPPLSIDWICTKMKVNSQRSTNFMSI